MKMCDLKVGDIAIIVEAPVEWTSNIGEIIVAYHADGRISSEIQAKTIGKVNYWSEIKKAACCKEIEVINITDIILQSTKEIMNAPK